MQLLKSIDDVSLVDVIYDAQRFLASDVSDDVFAFFMRQAFEQCAHLQLTHVLRRGVTNFFSDNLYEYCVGDVTLGASTQHGQSGETTRLFLFRFLSTLVDDVITDASNNQN